MKCKTVNDMYAITKSANIPLLSDYNSVFWNEYRNNFARYDKLFNRFYRSFIYFMQEHEQTIEDVTMEFTEDVYNHLMLNDKRYSELWRINVIDDDSYSIIDNYDMTETMEKSVADNKTDIYGNRTDNTSHNIGEKTDTENTVYGVKEHIRSEDMGQRTDTSNYSQGVQSNDSTNTVSPYDSENFYNNSKVNDTIGSRQDSNNTVTGAQSNVITDSEVAHTDNKTLTSGAQNNTDNFVKGEQTDTHNASGTENYTLHRKGNIGVMTSTDVMQKAVEFWQPWEFYMFIFRDIARELLLVD